MSHIMIVFYVFKRMLVHIFALNNVERHDRFWSLRSTSIYDIFSVSRNLAIPSIVATNFLQNTQPSENASKFEEPC
jgi:hypothetical protein